jgi:HSP20 family protein
MRPRVEICDQPHSHFVTATFELPGIKKEEIGVHLTHDGRLTISGDRHPPPFLSNTDPALPIYPVKELKYGRFERTINVPSGLEVKDINASLADGMLSVSWPRTVLPVPSQGPTQLVAMA